MAYWITPAGFQRKTLQEIRLELEAGFKNILGPDCDVSPEGVNGMLIALLALALSSIQEGGQEVYTAHDPSQASGTALDIIASLSAVSRIQASAALAPCILYCEEAGNGTLVPAGKQVRRVRGGVVFSLLSPVTISRTACRDIYLKLSSHTPGASVTLSFGFGTYTVTAQATELATYQAFVNLILADADFNGSAWAFTSSNPPVGSQITNATVLRVLDVDQDFAYLPSGNWTTPFIGSNGNFQCSVIGPETAAAGEVTEIVTPVSGWSRVYNQVAAQPGRNTETDTELRIRRASSFRAGLATEEAIKLQLLNRVEGIISAVVDSNRGMTVDSEGRPGKSYEAIVDGGFNEDIAKILWEVQPAGIESFGYVSVDVVDSEGKTQTVKFNRPFDKWLYMKVHYKLYTEEDFPTDGEARLRATILAFAVSEFTLGKDVIPQRFYTPVYSVPGIGEVSIEVAVTAPLAPPPTTYVTTVIEVGTRDRILLDTAHLQLLQEV
jgi:uncharacterized phage protein gp47/JayE